MPNFPSVIRISELCKPQPKQQEFLRAAADHRFPLYGGAAGGGKSWILRWWLLLFLLNAYIRHGIRNCAVALFCEDYPSLKGRQLGKIEQEFPSWLGSIREDRALGLVFKLRDCYGGGYIHLLNLDQPSRFDSFEFSALAIDELGKNKIEVFNQLRKRLRWPIDPKKPHFPCGGKIRVGGTPLHPEYVQCPILSHHEKPAFVHPFAAATNPGGPGHAWIKKLWVDRDFPPELKDFAGQFILVKALAQDNAYNPPGYFAELKSLPPKLAKAYAEGDWSLFEGMFFEEWREDYHVCQPFPIPDHWTRFAAMDWGFFPDYFCCLWFAVSPDNRIYAYREAYDRRITVENWAKRLLDLNQGEKLSFCKLDPDCWKQYKKYDDGVAIGEQFCDAGWMCSPALPDRKSGWARVREYLHWEEDHHGKLKIPPRLQIFNTCKNLIRTMPLMIHDENDVEDVQKKGLEDHAVDALRFGLLSRPLPTITPMESLSSDWAQASLLLKERKGTLVSPFDAKAGGRTQY